MSKISYFYIMVLVTGGTGLVGSHLLYFLLKENETVRAIRRKKSDLSNVLKVFSYYTENSEELFKRVEWIEADITEIPSLIKAFEGITKVYHCAAFISFDPSHFQTLKKVNIEGTANVVNLCLSEKVEKLCYVSSVAALGQLDNGKEISENTEWNQEAENSVYAITKYGAEMEVWRGVQEGLEAVIVNPSVIIGEGFWDSGVGTILKILDRKKMPLYPTGGIGVVDVRDVVSIMVLLMEGNIRNQKFILSAHNLFYKTLFSELAVLIERKPPYKKFQKWKLMLVSNIDWFVHKIFGTSRKVLKAMVASMYTVSFYDNSKIIEAIDYKFIPLEKTLKRITKYYSNESDSTDS